MNFATLPDMSELVAILCIDEFLSDNLKREYHNVIRTRIRIIGLFARNNIRGTAL